MERKIKMLSKQQNFGVSSGIVTADYEKLMYQEIHFRCISYNRRFILWIK